jgi:hypothetical protein
MAAGGAVACICGTLGPAARIRAIRVQRSQEAGAALRSSFSRA